MDADSDKDEQNDGEDKSDKRNDEKGFHNPDSDEDDEFEDAQEEGEDGVVQLPEAHEGDGVYFQMDAGEARLLSYTREVEGEANNEMYTDNFRGVTDNENGGGATDEEELVPPVDGFYLGEPDSRKSKKKAKQPEAADVDHECRIVVYVDIETNDSSGVYGSVISIAYRIVLPDLIIITKSTLCNTTSASQEWNSVAKSVHGLTPKDVEGKPTFPEYWNTEMFPILAEIHARYPNYQIHFAAYNGNKMDMPFLVEVFTRFGLYWPEFITHSFDLYVAITESKSVGIMKLKEKCRAANEEHPLKLSNVYSVLFDGNTFDHHNAIEDVKALFDISNHPSIILLQTHNTGYKDIPAVFYAQEQRSNARILNFKGNRSDFEKIGWEYEQTIFSDGIIVEGSSIGETPSMRPPASKHDEKFNGEAEGAADVVRACTTLIQLFMLFLPMNLLLGNIVYNIINNNNYVYIYICIYIYIS